MGCSNATTVGTSVSGGRIGSHSRSVTRNLYVGRAGMNSGGRNGALRHLTTVRITPGPAIAFMHDWKRCTTADERMMQVDMLVQALHGSGALAPLFIDGDSKSIRVLLDQLSGIGACSD